MTTDSEFAEGVRRSMAEPFTPLNRRQPKPKLKIQPSWWAVHGEEIGLLCWMFAITLAAATFVMTWDKVIRLFVR